MSSANNSTKSGKPCGSPDDYYENELVDWLQYPLGDSLEKGYCSDIFGQWPSSSTVVTKIPAAYGVSKPSSATSIGIDPCAYSDTGPPSKPDCAVVTVDSGLCDGKERVGNSSFGARVACADGALALGAERAAGLVSQSGRDEFSKVRTSMQPLTGSQLTPLAGSQLDGKGAQPFQVRNVTEVEPVVGNMVGNMSQNPVSGPKCPSEPLNVVNSYGASLSSSLASTGPSSLSKSISFSCYRPRNSVEAPLQVLHAQESGCSRVTDEAAVRRVLDKSSSASSRGQPGVGQVSGVMSTRFNSPALEAPSERPGVFGMTEMTVAAPSSRSLSGTTLSTKETSSNSGKRKVDDSESQSEDVEGESSVDVKQPRKPSSSKRNRAAEVHNLSERNRRNRINEKLRALQDLIPNSSKTDKASVLDEAIEYMKTLQMQLQMVSMRSGLNVSPMMIPLGMPHLQMAPLHPVGLGVPVGHAGLGMGVGLPTSMGMGMLDLSQGLPGRPLQQAHASLNRFSVPCQVNSAAGSQDCPLDSANTGSLPSQFMSMPHNFSQIHPGLNNLSSAYCQQQQDHRQHDVHHLEAREHIPHEQTGKG